jgi:hypothetical protein
MKTTGAAPSRPFSTTSDWEPQAENLKHYPHFDAPLKLSEIKAIVNDPGRVARNAFFPLIQYEKRWQPFRTPDGKSKPKAKTRKIRYAARRDAYIYSRYRRILAPLYEHRLASLGISSVPIAYRKIPGAGGKGKCNIDFAKDAFDYIESLEDCFVISLDISQFFESLDHARIEDVWKDLLGVSCLPEDHAAVFRSLTNYRWIDRTEAYERLGFFGQKTGSAGKTTKGFRTSYSRMPKQLCTPKDFREKICGAGSLPSIVRKHAKDHGIPQGTPISDLVANMYMLEFDAYLNSVAKSCGGAAFRYSDDILLIVRVQSFNEAKDLEDAVIKYISSIGKELVIKEEKCSIHRFHRPANGCLEFQHLKGAGKNGLEYLGFRFDGQRIFLRNSTVSNLKRKMTFSARARSSTHKRRYPNKTYSELVDSFNYDHFFQTFMRVQDFDPSSSVKNWTFWTYARRASAAFGSRGRPILKQLKHLKPDGKRIIETEFAK